MWQQQQQPPQQQQIEMTIMTIMTIMIFSGPIDLSGGSSCTQSVTPEGLTCAAARAGASLIPSPAINKPPPLPAAACRGSAAAAAAAAAAACRHPHNKKSSMSQMRKERGACLKTGCWPRQHPPSCCPLLLYFLVAVPPLGPHWCRGTCWSDTSGCSSSHSSAQPPHKAALQGAA
jgi:hypothetical protein